MARIDHDVAELWEVFLGILVCLKFEKLGDASEHCVCEEVSFGLRVNKFLLQLLFELKTGNTSSGEGNTGSRPFFEVTASRDIIEETNLCSVE